jgi:hypothetical protein
MENQKGLDMVGAPDGELRKIQMMVDCSINSAMEL